MAIDDIGSVRLRVEPDLDQAELRRQLARFRPPKLDLPVRILARDVNTAVREVNKKKLAALRLDVNFSRAQLTRDLRRAAAGLSINVRVNARGRGANSVFGDPAEDKVLVRQRQLIASRLASALSRIEAQTAATRERINAASLAKITTNEVAHNRRIQVLQAQQNARIELLYERHRLAMQRKAAKPIIQRIVTDVSRVTTALGGIERLTGKTLKVMTAGFAVWGVGVTAVFAGISGAAIIEFAKVERAAAEAASVLAFDQVRQLGVAQRTQQNVLAINRQIREELTDAARDVAANTVFSTKQAAEGYVALAQAGLNTRQSIAALPSVANFAQAGFLDLAGATDKLVQSYLSAGFEASKIGQELPRIADLLTFAAQDSVASLGDILDAFTNRSGAAFATYGQDVSETITVLDLFAKAGFTGLKAGEQTAILIREITRSSVKTEASIEAFKKYNIQVANADGTARSFAKVLDDVARALQNQGIITRRADGTLRVLPKRFAEFRKELALTEKSGAGLIQLLPQIVKLQAAGGGAAAELARVQREARGALQLRTLGVKDTLAFQFETFANNVQNLATVFAGSAGNTIKQFLVDLNGGLQNGQGLFDRLEVKAREFGQSFAKFVGGALKALTGPEGKAFFSGIVDGIQLTLTGVREFFTAFSEGFSGNDSPQSSLEATGNLIRDIGELFRQIATPLGKTIGSFVRFVRENKELIEDLAKVALALFVVNKALKAIRATLLTMEALGIGKVLAGGAARGAGGAAAGGAAGQLTAIGGAAVVAESKLAFLLKRAGLIGAAFAALDIGIKSFSEFNSELDRTDSKLIAANSAAEEVLIGIDKLTLGFTHFGDASKIRRAEVIADLKAIAGVAQVTGGIITDISKGLEDIQNRPARFDVADILKARDAAREIREGRPGKQQGPPLPLELNTKLLERQKRALANLFRPTDVVTANKVADAVEKLAKIDGIPDTAEELTTLSRQLKVIGETPSGNRFLQTFGRDIDSLVTKAGTSQKDANKLIGRIGTTPVGRQFLNDLGIKMDQAAQLTQIKGELAGNNLIKGLQAGIQSFLHPGSELQKLLHVTIPQFIRDHKGPVSYDATILVPAGQAIMQGLTSGLQSGFEPVKGFLSKVGPSMQEFIPDSLFGTRVGDFLVDVAMGKKPDVGKFFADLVPEIGDLGAGIFDPRLGFLHRTSSLADTAQMAASLAKTFGLQVSSLFRPGAITSAGLPSDHGKGTAADFSNGNQPTPQMDALAAAIKPLFGSIFKQIIWRNKDVNRGFHVPDHMDHVHAAWLPAADFSLNSGKIGKPMSIPNKLGAALGGGGLEGIFAVASSLYNVPIALIKAVTKAESNFNANAGSSAGAKGLMQLLPSTFAAQHVGNNIFDPKQNILAGTKYLAEQLKRFHGNKALALAAYNAGPGNASIALQSFGETIAYVKKVLAFLKDFGGFREHGGPVVPGRSYIVGERGPEMFTPSARGSIVSNKDMSRQGSSSVFNYNIQTASKEPEVIIAALEARDRRRLNAVKI